MPLDHCHGFPTLFRFVKKRCLGFIIAFETVPQMSYIAGPLSFIRITEKFRLSFHFNIAIKGSLLIVIFQSIGIDKKAFTKRC